MEITEETTEGITLTEVIPEEITGETPEEITEEEAGQEAGSGPTNLNIW